MTTGTGTGGSGTGSGSGGGSGGTGPGRIVHIWDAIGDAVFAIGTAFWSVWYQLQNTFWSLRYRWLR